MKQCSRGVTRRPARIIFSASLIAATFFAGSIGAQSGSELTVDDLIVSVLQTYPEIREAKEALNAAEARVAQAHSGYYPHVSAQAGYVHVDPVSKLTLQAQIPGTTFSIPQTFQAQPSENYDAHIGAQIRLFDFGQTSANEDLAKSQANSARDNIILVHSKLAYLSVQLFYNVLFLARSAEVQKAQIADLEKSREATQHRVDTGGATGYDVLLIQVRIAEAKNQLLDTENSLEQQKIQIRRFLGLADDAAINLRGEIIPAAQQINEEELMTRASGERVDFLLARDAQRTARAQLSLAENSDNPSLALTVLGGGRNGYFPNVAAVRNNYAVGVQVDIPIYSGGKTAHQIDEAKANMGSSDARLEQVKRQVHAEVLQAIADVRTSEAKITNAEFQLRQAKDALSRAQLKYDNGLITTLELLDAQIALQRSELLNLQSLYNCVLAQYNLKRAIGERIWEGKNGERK